MRVRAEVPRLMLLKASLVRGYLARQVGKVTSIDVRSRARQPGCTVEAGHTGEVFDWSGREAAPGILQDGHFHRRATSGPCRCSSPGPLAPDERGIPTGAERADGPEYDFRPPRPDREYGAPDGENAATVRLDERDRYLMLFTGDPLPGVNRRSLGTEPMTCASNALQRGEGLATLQPGESFAATRGIEPA